MIEDPKREVDLSEALQQALVAAASQGHVEVSATGSGCKKKSRNLNNSVSSPLDDSIVIAHRIGCQFNAANTKHVDAFMQIPMYSVIKIWTQESALFFVRNTEIRRKELNTLNKT